MWKQLKDFDINVTTGKHTPAGEKQAFVVTVRVTKDDGYRPRYSWAIGTRSDPQPFRSHMHPALLEPTVQEVLTKALATTLAMVQKFIAEDRAKHEAANEAAETSRRLQLAGHASGKNPQANKGLNATGKTAKKRAKEQARQ